MWSPYSPAQVADRLERVPTSKISHLESLLSGRRASHPTASSNKLTPDRRLDVLHRELQALRPSPWAPRRNYAFSERAPSLFARPSPRALPRTARLREKASESGYFHDLKTAPLSHWLPILLYRPNSRRQMQKLQRTSQARLPEKDCERGRAATAQAAGNGNELSDRKK